METGCVGGTGRIGGGCLLQGCTFVTSAVGSHGIGWSRVEQGAGASWKVWVPQQTQNASFCVF
jgi:hypothetical protein